MGLLPRSHKGIAGFSFFLSGANFHAWQHHAGEYSWLAVFSWLAVSLLFCLIGCWSMDQARMCKGECRR